MTQGYIDSASTYEIIAVLGSKRPAETYPWAWQSAITVTSSLINTSHLQIAPAPSLESGAGGIYGHLMLGLAELISHHRPDSELTQMAVRNTKQWAKDNVDKIRDTYAKLKADNKNFIKWLERSITTAWIEHSERLGGLYNEEFIPELSRILNVSTIELSKVRELSCDLSLLKHYATNWPDDDNFRLMTDAYVVSALLRGRYHDYIAQKSSIQVIHHPFREGVLPHLKKSGTVRFVVSNTERYLSNIVLASAFAERREKQRVSCWVENVLKVRKAVLAGAIDTRQKDFNKVALDLAVDAAKRVDIRIHPRWLDEVLDAIFAIGVGALASFVLNSWTGFVSKIIHYGVSRKVDIGKEATCRVLDTKARLRDLAISEPGRIKQTWKE